MHPWKSNTPHDPDDSPGDLELAAVSTENAAGSVTEHVSARLLHLPAVAADILSVPESWLRRKAGRREIPCTFVGKHLRFSDDDLRVIARSGARASRRPAPRHRPR